MPHPELGPIQLRFDENGRPIPLSPEEKKVWIDDYMAYRATVQAEPDTDPPGTDEALHRYLATRPSQTVDRDDHGGILRWLTGIFSMPAHLGSSLKTRPLRKRPHS